MPSTPVQPRPNRIFIRSIAHFHASKIPASPERCLSPPTPRPLAAGATHHCRGSTPQATTFSTLGTTATTNRCRDQIRRDGLHPHLGTATQMDLTRTINHTSTPTLPRHHRRHLTRRWSGARCSPRPYLVEPRGAAASMAAHALPPPTKSAHHPHPLPTATLVQIQGSPVEHPVVNQPPAAPDREPSDAPDLT